MAARSRPHLGLACRIGAAFALVASLCHPAHAQDAPDTMIVFDGSGSMWGQIEGRTKIEIARDTLSSVLSESASGQRMGMIAYGHRRKGQCSDIETVVPVGPAQSTVPSMLDAARRMNPKGKTPLTDAVRRAASELRYTENAATVVLVTDGIETCEADPCALASELERDGIDFTAHVVGFGLSDEEGRQVACLADNTGGLYIQASNAADLTDALSRTIAPEPIAPDPSDLVEEAAEREVHFVLRDTDDGDMLHANDLTVLLETAAGEPVDPGALSLSAFAINGRSATAALEPGDYRMLIRRDGGSRGGYRTTLDFAVPPGDGVHTIERSLSGVLVINAFLNPAMPLDPANPPESARNRAWAYFKLYPVTDGTPAEEPVAEAYQDLRFPLPAGPYLIRASLDRSVAAERLVEVDASGVTEIDFSFDVTPVHVEARDPDGFPIEGQLTYVYDGPPARGGEFARGRPARGAGTVPFFLPTGVWAVNDGPEHRGERGEVLVEVPGDFQPIRIRTTGTETLPDDAASRITPCLDMVRVEYVGCLVEYAELGDPQDEAGGGGPFQGRWRTAYGEVPLRHDGARVFGDYRDKNGVIAGRMQADGVTMRGVWVYEGGSDWGTIEWRLAEDGRAFQGGWSDGSSASADSGSWSGTLRAAGGVRLSIWPAFDGDWWDTVDAGSRAAVERWAGGPLLGAEFDAPVPTGVTRNETAPGPDAPGPDAPGSDALGSDASLSDAPGSGTPDAAPVLDGLPPSDRGEPRLMQSRIDYVDPLEFDDAWFPAALEVWSPGDGGAALGLVSGWCGAPSTIACTGGTVAMGTHEVRGLLAGETLTVRAEPYAVTTNPPGLPPLAVLVRKDATDDGVAQERFFLASRHVRVDADFAELLNEPIDPTSLPELEFPVDAASDATMSEPRTTEPRTTEPRTTEPTTSDDGRPADLAGLSGTAHAFARPDGSVALHIVVDEASGTATVILSDGWCGTDGCGGLRASVAVDEVHLATGGGSGVGVAEVDGHRLEIASFGGDRRILATGPDGAQATFSFLDRIVLAAAPAPAEAQGEGTGTYDAARASGAGTATLISFATDAITDRATMLDTARGRLVFTLGWCGGEDAPTACPQTGIAR